MVRALLLVLLSQAMHPYWHVPKWAINAELVANTDGTTSLVCPECSKTVKTWPKHPTLTEIVKATKGHKHK